MNCFLKRITALLILLSVLLAGCQSAPQETTLPPQVDAGELVELLLQKVAFDTELADVGESSALYFQELPEYAMVTMYSGSGYYADELTWITLAESADMEQALDSVDGHVAQVREHFLSYIPEELDKIDNAQVWSQGVHIILCITNDYENAAAIMADPAKAAEQAPTQEPTQESTQEETEAVVEEETTEQPTQPATQEDTAPSTDAVTEPTMEDTAPPTDAVTEPTMEETVPPTDSVTEPVKEETVPPTEPPTTIPLNADGYPAIISEKEELWDNGEGYLIGNAAYDYYWYREELAQTYANLVSSVALALQNETKVYSMLIPTPVGIMLPDNIAEKFPDLCSDQGEKTREIYSKMDSSVIQVNCYDNLMRHRNEYLYFRTDWHWNGPGAYYAYETFCNVKGIAPYTMQQRQLTKFDGFLGGMYQKNFRKEPALAEKPDQVLAYHPYFSDAYMFYTDEEGKRHSWPIISDVESYGEESKYSTFAAADQPLAEFYNPAVTDGSVAIVVKESYGNALMPFLVDHYSVIYEIDYRYWKGNLVEYARQVGADEILFANNLSMITSNYLVGLLDRII